MEPIARRKQRVWRLWMAGLAAATLAMLLLLVWKLDADPGKGRLDQQAGVSSSQPRGHAPMWPLGETVERLILESEGLRSRPAGTVRLDRERARSAQPTLDVPLDLANPARPGPPPDPLALRKKFLTREQVGLGLPVPHEGMAPEPMLDELASEKPEDSPVGHGR